MRKRITALVAALAVVALALAGCSAVDSAPSRSDQAKTSEQAFEDRTPPDVTGDAEYENYIKAQEDIYDDPAGIIWCTVYPSSDTAPIFTVPIAGKLTSSSVSYYPNYNIKYSSNGSPAQVENQSVDGMYHGSPVPYRYGFTPGGQYVDFTDLPTFCTTALTAFQRETLQVAAVVDDGVTKAAEDALKAGDPEKAQEIADGAAE